LKEEALTVRPGAPVQLRAEARGAVYDFSWSSDGTHWHMLVKDADGTILSTKRAGGFVGAVFGLHAYQPAVAGMGRGR
jgi:alpha-N-arabinofuranosidase